jgi:hypothetical protein
MKYYAFYVHRRTPSINQRSASHFRLNLKQMKKLRARKVN